MNDRRSVLAETVVHYSVDEMCRLTAVTTEFIYELVEYGVLEPEGRQQQEWRFTSEQLRLCRRANGLQRDLQVNVPGIGVTLQLLQEVEELRRKVAFLERVTHDK